MAKKKKPSYDMMADMLGMPSTNHQKKKAAAKLVKNNLVVKEYSNIFTEILKTFKTK